MAGPGRSLTVRSRTRSFERLLVLGGLFLLVPICTFIMMEFFGDLRAPPLPHLHEFYHGLTEAEHSHKSGTALLSSNVREIRETELLGQKSWQNANVVLSQESSCEFARGVDQTANITSQRLYDEIEFKNEEGGVWRQGWPVTYEGSEWDVRKLRVFVVPHSHNDPGWILTVEEYYNQRTFNILNVIVQALKADSRRKFIWEEMSYLSLWWEDKRVTQAQRDDFKWLIETGQLEIVGGGWVMNDEANSHHYAIVDQMIEGHAWIQDHLGAAALPRNAWAIDPFGHSPSMAYINKRTGFHNMLIQRTHYEVKKKLALTKDLEFVWRQAWDPQGSTDILTHMMPFYSYDIPHTCGPDPAICCQFDFIRMPSTGSQYACPWNIPPEEINEHTLKDRSEMILDQWRKKSVLFRTNAVLIPLGDDFRYQTQLEAEVQYNNYQAIFDHINGRTDLHVEAKWGTLKDYFQALREELAAGKMEGFPAEIAEHLPAAGSLPVLSGDFFTYSDRMQDYWSGYYVSRPFFKSVDRVLEETLRAAEILFSLTAADCPKGSLDALFAHLVHARRNLAVFQHHDGVTGTAKDHVVEDYGRRMHESLTGLQTLMTALLPIRLAPVQSPDLCRPLSNAPLFSPEQSRSAHDVLPLKRPVEITGQPVRIVLFNPLAEFSDQVFTTLVRSHKVCVLDANQQPVSSQTSPVWDVVSETPLHRLHFRAQLLGLSLQTYFLTEGDAKCQLAEPASVHVFNQEPGFQCPEPYTCSSPKSLEHTISNEQLSVSVDTVKGLVTHLTAPSAGVTSEQVTLIDEEFSVYRTRESGAYLFLPLGEAEEIVEAGGAIYVVEGPLFKEVHSKLATTFGDKRPIVRSARLYAGQTVQGSLVEMHHRVEIGNAAFDNREFIVRYRTDVESGAVFHSDLNGLQMARRKTFSKIPLQGNYYPMPTLAFLQDETRRFSVHTRQAVGAASLKGGWLEMMLDRRLVQDDNRGLGQGVTDNHPNEVVFQLTVEANLSSTGPLPQPWHPSLFSHRVTDRLAHTVHAFVGKPKFSESGLGSSYEALPTCLPSDLQILNLKTLRKSEPTAALLLHRRGFDCSYGQGDLLGVRGKPIQALGADGKVNLAAMFDGLKMDNVRKTSLTLLHDEPTLGNGSAQTTRLAVEDNGIQIGGDTEEREEVRRRTLLRELHTGGFEESGWDGHVTVKPMEIAAYKMTLARAP